MPLEPGGSWTYQVVSGDRRLGTETLEVIEELPSIAEDDPRYRRFRVREPEGVAVWTEDGRTVMRSAGRTFVTVIQHPPFVGSGWTDSLPGGSPVYCSVVRRETVETPAGTFPDCLVVRREAADLSSLVTQWFAPDTGLVKWTVERPGQPSIRWDLTKHR